MPPPPPRAGIGEWPAWGDEPPELWFRQVHSAPVPAAPFRLPPGPAPAARPKSSRIALAGFILGLLGACLSWVPLGGLGCGLFGAVLSLQARRATPPRHPGRALPTAGLVLGCIGTVFGVGATAIAATVALNALFNLVYNG